VTGSADYQTPYSGCWRPAFWTLLGVLLLLPAVAMHFTEDVRWTGYDFAAAIAFLAAIGCSIDLIKSINSSALITGYLHCWRDRRRLGDLGKWRSRYLLTVQRRGRFC
jgi:hypothetical protein